MRESLPQGLVLRVTQPSWVLEKLRAQQRPPYNAKLVWNCGHQAVLANQPIVQEPTRATMHAMLTIEATANIIAGTPISIDWLSACPQLTTVSVALFS
jgi:hypothetical protein